MREKKIYQKKLNIITILIEKEMIKGKIWRKI